MEIVDDIAYGVHDLEGGIAPQLVHREMWRKMIWELDQQWLRAHSLTDLDAAMFCDPVCWLIF
ncbi:hypothetical protein [Desulfonatronum thioautotrophicum]|uniref:hypothetical protein n=1 Tax=Desulfonatronum thioautotrophicum TaxID=617001 RepID=UPI00129464E7|nr:hypothetical protein [Desulfonatronum thioautotrophicum]